MIIAPKATKADVNAHAAKLIGGSDWMSIREMQGGKPMPKAIKDYNAAVRDASDEISAMDPIPADFIHSDLWPKTGALTHGTDR